MDQTNPQTNMAERMASIAVAATKELAIKDFIAEPDSNVFLESALSMVKMLSTQLMMVNVKVFFFPPFPNFFLLSGL